MSFFTHFTKIIAGKSQPVKATPKVKPQVKAQPDPAQLAVAQTQARELIIEAKDQAFQLKRQADVQAQRIIQDAQALREKSVKQLAEVDHRLGAVEQREKTVFGQEKHLQEEQKD